MCHGKGLNNEINNVHESIKDLPYIYLVQNNGFFTPQMKYVIRENARLGKCPFGEVSLGELSFRERTVHRQTVCRGKVRREKVRWGNVCRETVRIPFK